MPEYDISYRLYSPESMGARGQIGEATLHPLPSEHSVDARLEFGGVEAADGQEAIQLADTEYADKAQDIVSTLAWISQTGIILGDPYDPNPSDQEFVRRTDGTTIITPLAIDISNRMLDGVDGVIADDSDLRRAFHWYNLGLSTQDPEDRLIALWTGLEAAATQQNQFNDETVEVYEEQKDALLSNMDNYIEQAEQGNSDSEELASLRQKFANSFGFIKKESIVEALRRVFVTEIPGGRLDSYHGREIEGEGLSEQISTLKDDRVAIVHYGEHIDYPAVKAAGAEELLERLLEHRLDEAYSQLVGGRTIPEEFKNISSAELDVREGVLDFIFDGADDSLSEHEIKARAFALVRSYRDVYGVPLDNLTDFQGPLMRSGDGYKYTPQPDWASQVHIGVLEYLNGAKRVPIDVITYNLNSDEDVTGMTPFSAEREEIEECCEDLVGANLANSNDRGYMISSDGKLCVRGDVDLNAFSPN